MNWVELINSFERQKNKNKMVFKSKLQCSNYFKKILNNYYQSQILNDNDTDLILKLLTLHPKYKEKIGKGIVQLYVGMNAYQSSINEFRIHRKDDTHENFSYIKIINSNTIEKINSLFLDRKEKIENLLKDGNI